MMEVEGGEEEEINGKVTWDTDYNEYVRIKLMPPVWTPRIIRGLSGKITKKERGPWSSIFPLLVMGHCPRTFPELDLRPVGCVNVIQLWGLKWSLAR